MKSDKSLRERVLQALGFELLAILLCTPVLAWAMAAEWQVMGVVTVANCLIALLWNLLFNRAYDRVRQTLGLRQGVALRIVHALLFEGGLIVLSVPLLAWWLNISLFAALVMDIGLLLFFLPYTYFYHWAYDSLREPLLRRYRTVPVARENAPGRHL